MSGKKGMKKYPLGIREEVVSRIRAGESQRALSREYEISPAVADPPRGFSLPAPCPRSFSSSGAVFRFHKGSYINGRKFGILSEKLACCFNPVSLPQDLP